MLQRRFFRNFCCLPHKGVYIWTKFHTMDWKLTFFVTNDITTSCLSYIHERLKSLSKAMNRWGSQKLHSWLIFSFLSFCRNTRFGTVQTWTPQWRITGPFSSCVRKQAFFCTLPFLDKIVQFVTQCALSLQSALVPDGKVHQHDTTTLRCVRSNIFGHFSIAAKTLYSPSMHSNQERTLGFRQLRNTPSSSGFVPGSCSFRPVCFFF